MLPSTFITSIIFILIVNYRSADCNKVTIALGVVLTPEDGRYENALRSVLQQDLPKNVFFELAVEHVDDNHVKSTNKAIRRLKNQKVLAIFTNANNSQLRDDKSGIPLIDISQFIANSSYRYQQMNFAMSEKNNIPPSTLVKRDVKEKKTLIVTTILQEPYIMLNPTANKSDSNGNDEFQGFIKDILDLLSVQLRFSYKLQLVADGRYGYYNESNKSWSGMLGEVIRGDADLAAADLTITSNRMQNVDFIPFGTVGLTLLMKKPDTVLNPDEGPTSTYFFLNGFSIAVWICATVAFIVVSLINYFVSKFTQAHDHPIGIVDGLTYSFGNMFFRKDYMQTRGVSLKFLSGVWWIFTFFLAVLYISSMSSYIMVQLLDLRRVVDRQNYLLKECEEIMQDSVKTGKPEIGLLAMGSSHSFFKNSKISDYQKYAEVLEKKPTLLSKSYKEGVQRVRDGGGKYAYVMESSSSKYISRKDCDLYAAPGTFDTKQHGFAIRQDSPFKLMLHQEMLKLQEIGDIRRLEHKWWPNYCKESDGEFLRLEALNHNPVNLSQMSGVFYFLLAGIVLSLIIFILEMTLRRRQGSDMQTFIEDRQELEKCEDVRDKRTNKSSSS